MNGNQLFTHTTNAYVNQPDNKTSPEEFLEDIEDAEKEELQKALMFFAGFDVMQVEEAFEGEE